MITRIVRSIRDKVKMHKPWVKLSCSPIGKYDDLSRYRSNGWNAYSRVAQDAQGWMREGWMDQLHPMMYFSGNHFYPFAIDWQENSYGHTVSAGLGVYMLSPGERNWPLGEMQRQLNVARSIGIGHTFFRAKFLLDNVKGIYDYVLLFDSTPALVPPVTWSGYPSPTAPVALRVAHTADGDKLSWDEGRDNSDGPYLLYNVYAADSFPVDISRANHLLTARHLWRHLDVRNGKQPRYYAVTAVDRYGNESAACQQAHPASPASEKVVRGMIANDGQQLQLPSVPFDAREVIIASMLGTQLYTLRYQPVIDISHIPEGTYTLILRNNKRITHQVGNFIVKRPASRT